MSRNIMRRTVIDSSSLILIYKSGLIIHFLDLYAPVIPESVSRELTVPGHDGADLFRKFCNEGSITVLKPCLEEARVITGTLHTGERDVILLFYEGQGDYIIIDDRKGGAFCRDNGIPYINALLSVKILFLKGKITEKIFINAWDRVIEIGRYSQSIVVWAENAGMEKLSEFM